jgi:excisionase family DNA binding protein
MQAFNSELFLTTSEAAELLEVHPSTVKRWTDAGELVSDKTEGGHRRIYLRDLLEFNGGTWLAPFTPFESHVWLAVRDALRHDDYARIVSLAYGWLLRGHAGRISALVRDLGSRPDLPFERLCDEAIQPLMEEVGMAWRDGRLRIGEEHLASHAVMEGLFQLTRDESRDDAPVAVVGSMEGNRHEIGALCIRILLERAGWKVHFVGADTPPDEFAALQRTRKADLVCVSFSPACPVGQMRRCFEVLSEFYRPERPYDLVFGGKGTDAVEDEGPFRAFRISPGVEGFSAWIQKR